MVLCQRCPNRERCKSICDNVRREITGRGKTASRKPKTYPVDFSYIENTHHSINFFQREVLSAMKNLGSGVKEQLINEITLQEALDKALSNREKKIIQLFREGYGQGEIAKILGVSQPRANFLLKRALKKLRNFLERGYKTA